MTKQSLRLLFSFLISFSAALVSSNTLGAACCGGGFAAPALIVGDDKAQFTTSYGYSHVVTDVGADALWRKRTTAEASETFKAEAAHIFYDRWQAGLSIPVVRRSRAAESFSGLGDLSGTIGYEYLPDWDYSPLRPKGLAFLQLVLPTGRSINEASSVHQLDARGRGFWSLGIGTILTKVRGRWDLYSSLDVHRSFATSYNNATSQGTLHPGYGGGLGFGAGFNLAALRLGGGLLWSYEDPVDATGTLTSRGSPQRYANASLSASYLLQNEWATTLTYFDQTTFGRPLNTSLGRGVIFYLQKRWLR